MADAPLESAGDQPVTVAEDGGCSWKVRARVALFHPRRTASAPRVGNVRDSHRPRD